MVNPLSPPTPTSPPNIHVLPQCRSQQHISSKDVLVQEMTNPLDDAVLSPRQAWNGEEPHLPVLMQLPNPIDTSKCEGTTLTEEMIHDW